MRVSAVASVFILVIAANSWLFGANTSDDVVFKGTPVSLIERNLAIALRTPISGIQSSASQTVRDLKNLLPEQEFTSFVIPLMAILKDERLDASVRMLAALALHDLHSARGDFAIQRTARFTESPRVAHLCTWLTVERMKEDSPEAQATAMR